MPRTIATVTDPIGGKTVVVDEPSSWAAVCEAARAGRRAGRWLAVRLVLALVVGAPAAAGVVWLLWQAAVAVAVGAVAFVALPLIAGGLRVVSGVVDDVAG